jgi:N-acetylglucosamine-6-phosphate deacetylase
VRLGVAAAVVDGALLRGDVEIADGLVAAVGVGNGNGRGLAVPGLVDLQVNGFGGVDFATADLDGYRRAGEALLESGVTAFQPTLISAPEDELTAALGEVPRGAIGPRVIGVHLEGPFLAPRRLGAHPVAARRDPDPALLDRLLAAGPVSEMTLAPELDGALELVDRLHERGVVVSCGHSDATAEEANRAFDRGVATVTHLFNAMRPFSHRDPGIAGAALAREDVAVQLIVDGQHLADETVSLVWRAAAGRVALVSDVVGASLGGIELEVRDGVPRRSDGVLAGSVRPLIEGMRRLCELGVPLVEAVEAVTAVPSRIARRPDLGTLRPRSRADVVVLDDTLGIERVLVAGV